MTGVHCSTSWAVSEITLFIQSLNALLHFSDLSLPSVCPHEGLQSLQGVSICLQSYPMGVLGRLRGGGIPLPFLGKCHLLLLAGCLDLDFCPDHCYLVVIIHHHLLHLRCCCWGLTCRPVPQMVWGVGIKTILGLFIQVGLA